MKSLLMTTTLAATLLGAGAAFAAPAMVTTTLNLRTGPGTGYAVETAMPGGAIVDVTGCIRGYGWCRVRWAGYDGWAASDYLAYRDGRYRGRSFSTYGAEIGIPLIAGVIIGNALHHDRDGHDHHDRDRRDHDRHGQWSHRRHGDHDRRDHDRDRHDHDRHDRGHDRNRHNRDHDRHDSDRDHHRRKPQHADHSRSNDHHRRGDDHRRPWQHEED